jgi:GAF domain-containing protein
LVAPGLDGNDARAQALTQASQLFAAVVSDHRRLLDVIARTAVDLVGDGCAVFLLAEDGERLQMVASAHRDHSLEVANRTYMAATPIHMSTSTTNTAAVARSGAPALIPVLDPATLAARAEAVLQPIVLQLHICSLCIVPIRARGRVMGVMSLLRSRPGVAYTLDDQSFLEQLAERAGIALEYARP